MEPKRVALIGTGAIGVAVAEALRARPEVDEVSHYGAVLRVVGRARPGGDAPRLAREARLRLLQRWRDEGIQTNAEVNPTSRRGPEPNAPSASSES